MEKRNRRLAFLLALAACFIVLFSGLYIAAETNHDCIGEDCPVCYQISVCENTLETLGYAVVAILAAAGLTFVVAECPAQPKTSLGSSTLITLKVKLSN